MVEKVMVKEVGMRDGLQMIKEFLPTEKKLKWCADAVKAGFTEIEITSLVPEKYLPQFSDSDKLIAQTLTIPGLVPTVLVPNLRGAERAFSMKIPKVACISSASESFNQANIKRSIEDSIVEFSKIKSLRDSQEIANKSKLIVGISSAFGCTLEGRVSVNKVVEIVEKYITAGADEILLADTVGYAYPKLVHELVSAVSPILQDKNIPLGLHFHDTRGTGLANVIAGLEEGVRAFDSSINGLGGCPNSPGATGNIATEDLVFALEAMGFDTGINFDALFNLIAYIREILPQVTTSGKLANVGLPKGFQRAVDV